MFSRRVISLLIVLSLVAQAMVLTNTDSHSNFVEDSSPLQQLPEYGGARGGGGGIELVWDNPATSTNPDSIISMGDYVLYFDKHHEKGTELFRSNGTGESVLVKDINPGENSSGPSGMTKVNDFAYFTADDGTHGRELWRTDGTEDGTFMVKDINPDDDFDAYCFTALGDEVLFKADDGTHGEELWKSDGTENGTVLLKDIRIGEGGSTIGCSYNRHTDLLGESQGFITFGNSVYFSANNGTWTDENRTGSEMWRSDGTSEGTYLVKDLWPGDGSGLQGNMYVLGNHLYFLGNDNGGNGTELWKTDGTEEGTVLLKDINPGSLGSMSSPGRMQLVGDVLFFFANDGSTPGAYDYEVWKTDGTEEGTVKVISDVFT
ncbi:MAG: hypothetical protein NZ820_10735, partial [Dehalococcoidia bacterium]|nr:hypothetical protein [Dehalococcoidia bacterium]